MYNMSVEEIKTILEARNQAFSKIWKIYLFILITFNAVAMFVVIYCYFAPHATNLCQELTNNISWIVKSADSSLSAFMGCITIFYVFDKRSFNKIIENFQNKIKKSNSIKTYDE